MMASSCRALAFGFEGADASQRGGNVLGNESKYVDVLLCITYPLLVTLYNQNSQCLVADLQGRAQPILRIPFPIAQPRHGDITPHFERVRHAQFARCARHTLCRP